MKKRAVVLLSGGLDSCIAAAIAAEEYEKLAFLHVRYHQKAEARELDAAVRVARFFKNSKTDLFTPRLNFLAQIGGSSLTDAQIPVQEFSAGEAPAPVLGSSAYVPFRNSIFASLAVAWAEVLGAEAVVFGFMRGDTGPDCQVSWLEALNALIRQGTAPGTNIVACSPTSVYSKAEAIRRGAELRAPMHLTWSCFRGDVDRPCGVCARCIVRRQAFEEAGIQDKGL